MSPIPSLREMLLYLRNNGARRSAAKFVARYLAGRQRWNMTCEDLTRHLGAPLPAGGYELRFARPADLAAFQSPCALLEIQPPAECNAPLPASSARCAMPEAAS